MRHHTTAYPVTAAPGLLSALAGQVSLTAAAQQQAQRTTLGQPSYVPRPTRPADPAPVAPADPAADSWQHNVVAFLRLLDTPPSFNPLNTERATLLAFPVLRAGWTDAAPLPADRYPLAPGRGGLYVNESLVLTLGMILRTVGYNRQAPVLFDGKGRILDGFHRLLACAEYGVRAYFIQLDY